MNPIEHLIEFSLANEIAWPRNPASAPEQWGVHNADPAPWNRLLGPVHERAGVSGMILRRGEVWQSWGDVHRAELTFSVAKTYLALLAGIAHDRGLLPSADEPVAQRLPGIGFDSPHNRSITWSHLLSQTSEWEGSCLGLPDQVERYRYVSLDPRGPQGVKGAARPLQPPGTYWEYNDVRINQLSLALLHLFGRALPEVFRESILEPLGAGANFSWVGYDDAWVELPATRHQAKQRVQSVPGGTHWGGGVSISTADQAKVGELMRQQGRALVDGKPVQLVSAAWVQRMMQPCPIAPFYGWLTWLNPGGATFPTLSAESVLMFGAGGNYVWIEPEHDAVIVVRWLNPDCFAEFAREARAALRATA